MMLLKVGATKTASVLIALIVMVSVVTVGVVAQPDSPNTNSSGEDTEPEPNDTIENATPIEYGSEINATLSSSNDTDYYAVPATAGCAIIARAQLKNASRGGTLQVDLISPTGEVTTELANSLMSGPEHTTGVMGDRVAYTGNVMEHSGTYYIRVQNATHTPFGSPRDELLQETYRYNLTVDRKFIDKYEPNENGTTATPLNPDETVNATSAGYDSDVYALNVTAGESYTVNLSFTLDRYYGTNTLYVYANRSQAVDDPPWEHTEDGKSPYYFEANGPTVASTGIIYGDSSSIEFTADKSGTYYLQLVQGQDNANLLDFEEYELTVTSDKNNHRNRDDELDGEPNDDRANATQIAYDTEINATLSPPNDTDYYAVNASAGYAIIARAQPTNFSKGGTIQVDLISPTGEVTTELTNDVMNGPQNVAGKDAMFPGKMAYTGNVMEYDDTYYIRVQRESSDPDQSLEIPYNLTVNREYVDEYEPNENGTTATPLNMNSTVTASFAGYDSDVYALNLSPGEDYIINLSYSDDRDPQYADMVFYVYANRSQAADDPPWEYAEDGKSPYYREANGPIVAMDGSKASVTVETDGTYYLQIVQARQNWNLLDLNEYELTVRIHEYCPDRANS